MKQRLVVVGNGMAGVSCVEQILKLNHNFEITIFGDETHVNYNRILLSMVLAGEKSPEDIVINDLEWYRTNEIRARLGLKIAGIDRAQRVVIDEDGGITEYDKLILATGSSAFNFLRFPEWTREERSRVSHDGRYASAARPSASGTEGCRDRRRASSAWKSGAGLSTNAATCTGVVHLMDTLMERQLDATGGEYLKRKIESLGIRVMLPQQTAALFGNGRVDGLRFVSGEELEAELVVVAAGIRPNADLGRKAGLEVHRGVVVNDYMETSDPDIFAVGECTEHRGQTFGLVAPLFEQGRVQQSADQRAVVDRNSPAHRQQQSLQDRRASIFSPLAPSTRPFSCGRGDCALRRSFVGRVQEAAAERQPPARHDPGRRYRRRALVHGCDA